MENRIIFELLAKEYEQLLPVGTPESIESTRKAIMTLLDFEICTNRNHQPHGTPSIRCTGVV